jgi:hypothetical protein
MKNKFSKIIKYILVGMGGILALVWAVPAQGVTDTHTVTFDNSTAIQLIIPETTYDFGAISPSSAAIAENVVNATVKSNANYSLKVKGDANFISGQNSIPIGRLQWATDSSNWTTMTTSDATVATGDQTDESGDTYGMDYKIQLNWDDPIADDYSATITYTATNP